MNRLILLVIVALVLVSKSSAGDVFSSSDSTRVQASLTSKQLKNGLFGTQPIDTYHAVTTLRLLGHSIPSSQQLCHKLSDELSSSSSSNDAALIALSLVKAKCSFSLPSSAKQSIESSLSSTNLEMIASSIEAISALVSANKATITSFSYSGVVDALADLADDDGLYRSSPDTEDSNAFNTGLALQALAALSKLKVENAKNSLTNAVAKLSEILDQIGGVEGAPLDIRSAGALLDGINDAQEHVDIELKSSQMNRLASYLLNEKYVDSIDDLFYLSSGLVVLADNKIFVPLIVRLSDNQVAGTIHVRVTNVLDAFATKVNVVLSALTSQEGGRSIVRDAKFTSVSDTEFEYKSDAWSSAEPGLYNAKVTATPSSKDGNFEASSATLQVKVTTKVTHAEISLSVSESAKGLESDISAKASYPSPLASRLSADSTKHLHVKVRLTLASRSTKLRPNQVFIQLTKGHTTASFVAKPAQDDSYQTKLSFGSAEVIESLSGSGDYKISVLVGDALLESALQWQVGEIQLSISDSSASSADEDFSKSKKEIKHNFRAPEPRASRFLSLLFSAAIAGVLAILILTLMGTVRVSIPSVGGSFIWLMIFHGSLAAILALYALYWLKFNIFQALAGLALLGTVAVLSGNRALRALYYAKEGKAKTE